MMQTKSECDVHWHKCIAIKLLLGTALHLIWEKLKNPKPRQSKLFANTVHIYIFLVDLKYYVTIKLMSTTGNHRDFTGRGTL